MDNDSNGLVVDSRARPPVFIQFRIDLQVNYNIKRLNPDTDLWP